MNLVAVRLYSRFFSPAFVVVVFLILLVRTQYAHTHDYFLLSVLGLLLLLSLHLIPFKCYVQFKRVCRALYRSACESMTTGLDKLSE